MSLSKGDGPLTDLLKSIKGRSDRAAGARDVSTREYHGDAFDKAQAKKARGSLAPRLRLGF